MTYFILKHISLFIFTRRDSAFDAVVMHPKHAGKKLADLQEER